MIVVGDFKDCSIKTWARIQYAESELQKLRAAKLLGDPLEATVI